MGKLGMLRKGLLVLVATCSMAIIVQAESKKAVEKILSGDSLSVMREKIAKNGWSFTVGNNWVYDLPKEKKSRMFRRRASTTFMKVAAVPGVGPLQKFIGKQTLPSSFDWRSYNGKSYIGDVRNQGSCGSCYSFGASAAAEGTYNFATGKYDSSCVDFSESYIAWCLSTLEPYKSHFYGCDGADYDYFELTALTKSGYYAQYDGAAMEADCPYSETAVTASDYLGKVSTIQFDSWNRVYPASYDDTTEGIKTAIMTYGVVDAAVNVTSAFEAYSGGVFEDSNTTPSADPYYNQTTNHAIALVGWDDNPPEGGGGCWILRNSWGSSWGESGYMRIRYKSAAVNCAACYLVYSGGGGGGGSATITMSCSPASAGTTSPTGSTTVTEGDTMSIEAVPASGYTFKAWSASSGNISFADSSASSTTATIGSGTGSATITATFTQAVEIDIDKLTISLDSGKTGKDKVTIRKAEYPWTPSSFSNVSLKVETYTFSCVDGTDGAWTNKGHKFSYKSYTKSPSIRITVDSNKSEWTAKITNANVHKYFDVTDGVNIELNCDDGVAAANYTYSDLAIKTTIKNK
jgi:C1A family cysteine protease